MPLPRARTRAEAQLYMSLNPCVCGEPDFDRDVDVVQVEQPRVLRYSGFCLRCGRPREFFFELAEGSAGGAADGDGGPSTLIDAGEWLLISDLFHDSLRELAESEELAEVPAPAVHDALRTAATAIDEILAFVPDGASRVPDEAFWTDRGLAVRHAVPERFGLDQLTAARLQRWRDVSDFEDVHPEPDTGGTA